MTGLAARLAGGLLTGPGRAILPTHPGFDGRPRPAWCDRVTDLALAYLALLERLDLDGVVVVGNSLGGWVGAELAPRASPRVAALVLLDAVGVAPAPATGAIVDPTTRAPAELPALAFHAPARGGRGEWAAARIDRRHRHGQGLGPCEPLERIALRAHGPVEAGRSLFHTRHPFASGGVYEAPATGAAAWAGYLRDLGWLHGTATEIIRGEAMGVPCRLRAGNARGMGASIRLPGAVRRIKADW